MKVEDVKGLNEAARATPILVEPEKLKAIGCVISQDSMEFINLVKHYRKSENMTLSQAKAMAALAMIIRQKKRSGEYNILRER